MSLTNYDTLSQKDYNDLIFSMLKYFEGTKDNFYKDGRGNATIGIGFEISANPYSILEGMGYIIGTNAFNNLLSALKEVAKMQPFASDSELQKAINNHVNTALGLTGQPGQPTPYGPGNDFGYGNNTSGSGQTAIQQMQKTFNLIKGGYEDKLDAWLLGVDLSNLTSSQISEAQKKLPDSTERAALLSLTYNNLIGYNKSPHLHQAIKSGNRAEAWYQIRYASDGAGPKVQKGVTKRLYDEAAIFGLYPRNKSGQRIVTKKIALSIYKMCTAHGLSNLQAYDKLHENGLLASKQISYANKKTPVAEDLPTTLLPAAKELSSIYGNGQSFNPLDILVANSKLKDAITAQSVPDQIGNVPCLLIASDGSDTLHGAGGADVLVAGKGNDVLDGGAGNDRYDLTALSKVSNTTDTINDSDGKGTIWVGSNQLSGGTIGPIAAATQTYNWTSSDGTDYLFRLGGGSNNNLGTLTIKGGPLGSGDQVVIDNFNLTQAETSSNGYLGIHLEGSLALKTGSKNFSLADVLAQKSTTVKDPAPGTETMTAYVSQVSDKPQTLTLAMTQGNASGFAVVGPNGTLEPLSSGVSLTVAPGQDSVTFSLVNTARVPNPETVQLTLSEPNPNGSSTRITSTLSLDYSASPTLPGAGIAADTIQGDLTPIKNANGQYQYNSLGNLIVNPSSPDPGFNDTLYGSANNDLIKTGSGNNYVNATQGGNDTIQGGNGQDTIYADNGNNRITDGNGRDSITAGNGNNIVTEQNGQDVVQLGNGDNTVYGANKESLSSAMMTAGTGTASGQQGSLVGVGKGNNTIVGGSGNDAYVLGGGNDLLVLGPGNDTVIGGEHLSAAQSGWATINSSQATTNSTTYSVQFQGATLSSSGGYAGTATTSTEVNKDSYGAANGVGSETIFGGNGNDFIMGSNGPGNYIDTGNGDSTVFSGAGNDTINAGSGNDIVYGQAGNDLIKGGSGNDVLQGDAGNNTIYGGSGNDTINAGEGGSNWASFDKGNNYVYGGSGNSQIEGTGGKDTLIAGSGNSTVIGGQGQELIEGGAGKDLLASGSNSLSGSDTLVAGSGNNTLVGGGGTDYLYGGTGTDVIYGGSGTEVIHTGDGGTATAVTKVVVGAGKTTVYGGAGSDSIKGGSGSDTLIAGSGDATLQGGNGWDQVLRAGSGSDLLKAGTGSDTLIGGDGTATLQGGAGGWDTLVAGSGQDTLIGGSGENTYEINAGFGSVEIKPKHNDVVKFGSGISLSDLTVTGSLNSAGKPVLEINDAYGGSVSIEGGLNDHLATFEIGGEQYTTTQLVKSIDSNFNNAEGLQGNLLFTASAGYDLLGTGGNDTLVAFGANTTMTGGGGNTLFMVNNSSEVVSESNVGLQDTISSSVSYVLPENVDRLDLTGYNDLVGVGNNQSDLITGNKGNDTLIAGAGLSTLVGASGQGTFVVNNEADVVKAASGKYGSNYIVDSSVNYVMPANVQALTGIGNNNIVLTGNASGSDTITANSGNDTLVAGSGQVNMVGGSGTDTFLVNQASDSVKAQAGTGDTVKTSVSYNLPQNVQYLEGTGNANIKLTANSQSGNTVIANSGNDTLSGGGGSGVLQGGSGSDTFVLGAPGNYTAEKNSGVGAVVRLIPGLSFSSDVTAERSGNNLVLQVGDKSTLKLKNYYTDPSQWTIENAQGSVTTGQYLVNETKQKEQSTTLLTRLENSFETTVKDNFISGLLKKGYKYEGNGSWVLIRNNFYKNKVNVYWAKGQQKDIYNWLNENTGQYYQTVGNISPWSGLLHPSYWENKYTQNIQEVTQTATSFSPYKSTFNETYGGTRFYGSLPVQWVPSTPQGAINTDPTSSDQKISYIQSITDWYLPYPNGKFLDTEYHVINASEYPVTGYITSDAPTYGYFTSNKGFPTGVPVHYSSEHSIYSIKKMILSSGDHYYWQANSATLVESGTGNNTIIGAGFVDAGTGNDTIKKAGTVFCKTGNDTIDGASIVYGGTGNDYIDNEGTPVYGQHNTPFGTVYGGAGNETIIGAANVMAGTGVDSIFGSGSSTTIQINNNIAGMDLIGNLSNLGSQYQQDQYQQERQFLNVYYQNLGQSNGAERYWHANTYVKSYPWGKVYWSAQQATEWLHEINFQPISSQLSASTSTQSIGPDSYLQAAINEGYFSYLKPLPSTVPLVGFNGVDYPSQLNSTSFNSYNTTPVFSDYYTQVGRTVGPIYGPDDFAALAPYYNDGQLPASTIKFGSGINPADFKFSWSVTSTSMGGLIRSYYPELYTTLNITWGQGKGIKILMPHPQDPLGSGIQKFAFANGTTMSMADMLSLAPLAPSFNPLIFDFKVGMGNQTLPTYAQTVQFGSNISLSNLSLAVSGSDLIFSDKNGTDSLDIPNGVVDSGYSFDNPPRLSYRFSNGNTLRFSSNDQGNDVFTEYKPSRITQYGYTYTSWEKLGDIWANSNGSHGFDVFNSNGSSSGTAYQANGSYSTYTNDGLGDVTTDFYNASGVLTGDSWKKANGSHGSDNFYANGSSSGIAYHPDGSYSTYTNDGVGDITTLNYTATGQYIGDTWQRANGNQGSDTFNPTTEQFVANYSLSSGASVVVDSTLPSGSAPIFNDTNNVSLSGGSASGALFEFGNNDTLSGGVSGQLVYGSGSGDVFISGKGNDTLIGTGNNDTFDINSGSGIDTIVAAGSGDTIKFGSGITSKMITLGIGSLMLRVGSGGQKVHIEGFIPSNALGSGIIRNFKFADGTVLTYDQLLSRGFDLYAGSGNVTLSGTNLVNRFYGGSGNDKLIGTGTSDTFYSGTGVDTMIGGLGKETYIVNNEADVVEINPQASSNQVETSVTYTVPDKVTSLTGIGSSNIKLTGNNLNDVITANSGNDTLVAGGGIDTLIGGLGHNTYYVNNSQDTIDAQANAASNQVYTSVSYAAPANVTSLTGISNANIKLVGNTLDDVITANSGNDTLVAGTGIDTLVGGSGNDVFVINNANDTLINNQGGIVTVNSSVSYVLPSDIQNLTLTGSTNINGTGNALNNVLVGNAGNDVLTGGGGNDTFVGGTGNDTFIGGSGNDTFVFRKGDGVDTIVDSAGNNTIRFGAGLNLQNVSLRLYTPSGEPFAVYENGKLDFKDANWNWRADKGSLQLTAQVRVLNAHGDEVPTEGMNFTVNMDRHGNITSPIQNFKFADGSSSTFQDLLIKTNFVNGAEDPGKLVTGRNDDLIFASSDNTGVWAGSGNDTIYASHSGTLAYGQGGNNVLYGGRGNDTLSGGWGNDLVEGGGGNDVLRNEGGHSALLGGAGNDTITALAGNDFIAGGSGNDLIQAGASHDVIAFNQGDGNDTLIASSNSMDTLSLGRVNYRDLTFSRTGDNLILNVNKRDSITFQSWYDSTNNQSVSTLQFAIGDKGLRSLNGHKTSSPSLAQTFDFSKLVDAFDQASSNNPSMKSWSLSNSLVNAETSQDVSGSWSQMNTKLDKHLNTTDTSLLGGSLAYDYAKRGSLSGISPDLIDEVLKNKQFGSSAQNINSTEKEHAGIGRR